MCCIHCTSFMLREVRDHELFGIRGAPRHCTDLCSLTHQVHELHRLDRISVSHQAFLSTQLTSLYFVMMSCNSELPTFRQRLQQCTPPRTHPCCLQQVLPTSRSRASPLTSRLTLVSHSRVKLNGHLAASISLLARNYALKCDAPTSSPGGTP